MNSPAKVLLLSLATLFIANSLYAGDYGDTFRCENPREIKTGADSTATNPVAATTFTTDLATAGKASEVPLPSDSTAIASGAASTISADSPDTGFRRLRKNTAYIEILGSGLNLASINYERSIRRDMNFRIGGSWFGYSTQLRYEDRGDDVLVGVFTIPVSVSTSMFGDRRQLELGTGLTFMSFTFAGGPFDVGYFDFEVDNRYLGLAMTGLVGYRVNVEEFMFRLSLSPTYMLTVNHELTGSLDELEAMDVLDFYEIFDFTGFRIIPGLSFGRRF